MIQSAKYTYEVVQKLPGGQTGDHYLCRLKEMDIHMIGIGDKDRIQSLIPYVLEMEGAEAFTDFVEYFVEKEVLYLAFLFPPGASLSDYLEENKPPLDRRYEIGKTILEKAILFDLPFFLQWEVMERGAVRIGEEEAPGFYYSLEHLEQYPDITAKDVTERAAKLVGFLLKEEAKSGRYPEIASFLEGIKKEEEQGLLGVMKGYLLLAPAIARPIAPEESKKESISARLKKRAKTIVKVAQITVGLAVFAAACLAAPKIWREKIFPIVESAYLVKSMAVGAPEAEGYSGRVELYDEGSGKLLWRGRMEEGRLNGYGLHYYPSGSPKYEGMLADGLYSGQGTLFGQDGVMIYQGDFLLGEYDGSGTLYDGEGALWYSGGFAQGEMEGNGSLYDESGRVVYEGGFVGGKYEGLGNLYQDGALIYEGEFKGGKYEGTGSLYEGGALVYEGEFKQGKPDGGGASYDNKKIVEEGVFRKGRLEEGTGFLYDEAGNVAYQGMLKSGKREGEGSAYEDGKLVYEGGFKGDVYEGEGKLYSSKTGKLVYIGTFMDGHYDGAGVLYDEHTQFPIYDGQFRLGRYDGEGTEYDECGGLKYQGGFLLGVYHGAGALYDAYTGLVLMEGEFRNGVLVTTKEELEAAKKKQEEEEAGDSGESGTEEKTGEDGEAGDSGESGTEEKAEEDGRAGDSGESGTEEKAEEDGEAGTDGKTGTDGEAGAETKEREGPGAKEEPVGPGYPDRAAEDGGIYDDGVENSVVAAEKG